MILRRFALQNVRGLTVEATVEPGVPLVVTGAPVSGKTSLLESLAAAKENAGAYGKRPVARDFRGADGARVSLHLEFEPAEQLAADCGPAVAIDWDLSKEGPQQLVSPALGTWLAQYDTSPSRWKMEYFHAGRGLSEFAETPEPSARLTRLPSKYGFVRGYLRRLVQEEASLALDSLKANGLVMADTLGKPRSRFSHALSLLAPTLRWDGCEAGSGGESVWFIRPSGPRVELGHLAESERAAVLVAASWCALGLERSLVLVDHPEQGLHPERHAAFFEGLGALMVNGQLIATTTSPAILRMLSRKQVLVLS